MRRHTHSHGRRFAAAVTLAVLLLSLVVAGSSGAGARPRAVSAPAGGSVVTAMLPVRRCTVTNAGVGSIRPTPQTVSVSLPRGLARKAAAYGGSGLVSLGPRGWSCQVLLAGNNGTSLNIRPSANPPKSAGAVRLAAETTCLGCVVDMACGFFEAAKRLAVPSCSYRHPAGERVSRLSGSLVGYYDPPGVKGYGFYSGLGNASYGRVKFVPGGLPFAASAECTLPARFDALCPLIVSRLLPK